ncbi:beta-ribofuranosylaminobenzene 5'-phosphate synthase family [Halorhabdus utahensis DSM 12940]|uniref:Beta-ribofuranosylaminobenzene 5'-phosphate synthase n=1 Tax=Halorhabdus utahensis (strain DSM 12940 / JCM 11049 / AX-2) TaxID=519442 RepID=C7NVJ9_HALUD|nr:beta-ribofuranosylaminobenzene 5'-phosphate synthase family protein [Halorhabdus utahensis]ACV12522.1 beta-ribofuranosylaminobenzene 5'-phosphate synthase family [Halorhabdus utahensis DSM 12940]
MTRVSIGARLHAGFQNLSLARDRLYGGIGWAIDEPRLVVDVERAEELVCPDEAVEPYARRAIEVLDVPGAAITVEQRFERHAGLGSGTRLALATLMATADVYDVALDVRDRAPDLGRGGRSGVGIATVLDGGFVVDGGHLVERFTHSPPETGAWTTPPVVARHAIPDSWRFVLVTPDVETGKHGSDEDASMRSIVEGADPGIADEIAPLLTQRLLPAIAGGDRRTFGDAITRLGRLNGAWYADEQGGVYRPPAGRLIESLSSVSGVDGVGQSSWGPTVYAITGVETADIVREAAEDALTRNDVEGDVRVVAPDNEGYRLLDS